MPAKKPPIAGFQLSSFSLRFAEAVLVNSYAPPIAAANPSVPILIEVSLDSWPTKHRYRAARSCEDAKSTHILLGEGVLDCRDESAGARGDQCGLDRSANGIFGLIEALLLVLIGVFGHCAGVESEKSCVSCLRRSVPRRLELGGAASKLGIRMTRAHKLHSC